MCVCVCVCIKYHNINRSKSLLNYTLHLILRSPLVLALSVNFLGSICF